MPIIASMNFRKKRLARDNHRVNPANDVLDQVFNRVTFFVSRGQRVVTYKEIADWDDIPINSVKYYFQKLVAVEAINLWTKEEHASIQQSHTKDKR